MKEWSYKSPSSSDFQNDWIQTLHTAINVACLDNKKKDIKYPVRVIIPTKLKKIIESLEYYHDGKIGDRYIVEFSDNIVVVGDVPLEIKDLK